MAFTLVRLLRTGRETELLRCLFHERSGPASLPPVVLSWKSGTVVRLAREVYDNRTSPVGTLDKDRLSDLADALEQAGWREAPFLDHLRGDEEHYRGCFVVDAVLGRS
jgi:hypothetical protein